MGKRTLGPPALKLPQCASCGHPRTEKQGPLSKKEKTRGPWYCEDCQQCEECEIYKPIEGNFGDDGAWHYSKRCLTCEHPLCTHCPKYRHPHTKIAVQRRHKVKDQWFCKRTAACTEMSKKQLWACPVHICCRIAHHVFLFVAQDFF